MRTALITGASRGLGRALARALAERGWRLVIDARGVTELEDLAAELSERTDVMAIPGDVADEEHRRALIDAAGGGLRGAETRRSAASGRTPSSARGAGSPPRLDLLVNNASLLGPSPQPKLADYDVDALQRVYDVNVFAPLRLTQLA